MKRDCNCNMAGYPMYPNMQPMPMNQCFNYPQYPDDNQNNDLTNIEKQLMNLDKRVTNLERTLNNSNSFNNDSNYHIL